MSAPSEHSPERLGEVTSARKIRTSLGSSRFSATCRHRPEAQELWSPDLLPHVPYLFVMVLAAIFVDLWNSLTKAGTIGAPQRLNARNLVRGLSIDTIVQWIALRCSASIAIDG